MASAKDKIFGFWLFGKSAKELSTGKKILFYLWNWLLSLLAALGTGLLSLLLAFGRYAWEVFFGYFTHPLIALLNLLPALLLFLILYCAVGRSWIAHLITSLLVLGLSTADYFMLLFRDDALMFADIMDAATAMGVVGNYNLAVDDRLLACILYLAVSTVFLALLVRGVPRWPVRAAVGVLALLVCVFPLRKTYLSENTYEVKAQNFDHVNRWSATQAYLSRGFLYPFLHSVGEAFPTAPAGYSADYARSLLAPYTDADIPEGQKVNVVTLMLEAFSDMSFWDIPGLSEEVMFVRADWLKSLLSFSCVTS